MLSGPGRNPAAPPPSSFPGRPPSSRAGGIFAQLDLALSDDDNRRVLAVLAHLDS